MIEANDAFGAQKTSRKSQNCKKPQSLSRSQRRLRQQPWVSSCFLPTPGNRCINAHEVHTVKTKDPTTTS